MSVNDQGGSETGTGTRRRGGRRTAGAGPGAAPQSARRPSVGSSCAAVAHPTHAIVAFVYCWTRALTAVPSAAPQPAAVLFFSVISVNKCTSCGVFVSCECKWSQRGGPRAAGAVRTNTSA